MNPAVSRQMDLHNSARNRMQKSPGIRKNTPDEKMSELQQNIYSVSSLVKAIKKNLEGEFKDITVVGEITNSKDRDLLERSAYWFFSIKDDTGNGDSQISCYMSGYYAARANFLPLNGYKVILHGKVSVYEKSGSLRLNVTSMQFAGDGKLREEFLRLQKKLQEEGLFDPGLKRPIPSYPNTIGIITSNSGMALGDIIRQIVSSHFGGRVILYPAIVQGISAPESLISQLRRANSDGVCDVLIIGRGGGSYEELFCFNDERLVREVRKSVIPVISAVGHTEDHCLCDDAADYFSQTPTAAGAYVVDVYRNLCSKLPEIQDWLTDYIFRKIEQLRTMTDRSELQLQKRNPENTIDACRSILNDFQHRIATSARNTITGSTDLLSRLTVNLHRVSPLQRIAVGRENLLSAEKTAKLHIENRQKNLTAELDVIERSLLRSTPDILKKQKELGFLEEKLHGAAESVLNRAGTRIDALSLKLSELNPLISSRFARSITTSADGRPISSVSSVNVGDTVTTVLSDRGRIISKVLEIHPDEDRH